MTGDTRFRETTRAPLEVPVKLQFDAFSDLIEGFTANLSAGGMFVSLRDPQPVGTLLRFELLLAGTEARPVRGLGEVVWLRLPGRTGGLPAGMGMQFRHLEGDGAERVRTAVDRAIAELGIAEEPGASRLGASEARRDGE